LNFDQSTGRNAGTLTSVDVFVVRFLFFVVRTRTDAPSRASSARAMRIRRFRRRRHVGEQVTGGRPVREGVFSSLRPHSAQSRLSFKKTPRLEN
jgi:hypothetical protein